MNNQANQTIFNNLKDYMQREVERIVSMNLEHKPYDALRSKDHIANISQQVIEKLTTVNRNFKYIVNVILLAKGGNGFDLGGLSYYNIDMDGTLTVRWESQSLTCIVQVYGIAN